MINIYKYDHYPFSDVRLLSGKPALLQVLRKYE